MDRQAVKYPYLEVQWSDSETINGWDKPEDVKHPTKLCKSKGYLIKEGKEYLTLAADYDEENGMFNRFIHIPLVNVKKKRRIKI